MFVARAQSLNYMYLTTCNNIVFERLVWAVKNASKRQCGRESIDAFSMTTKTHTIENVLVWTGRQMLPLQFPGIPVNPTLHGQVWLRSPTPGSFLQVEYDKLQWWRPESHG